MGDEICPKIKFYPVCLFLLKSMCQFITAARKVKLSFIDFLVKVQKPTVGLRFKSIFKSNN